jgi:hypothetical protein
MTAIKLKYPPPHAITPPLQDHAWEPENPQLFNLLPVDRSQPRPVEFAWERPAIEGDSLRYELLISKDQDFTDPVRVNDLKDTHASGSLGMSVAISEADQI